MGLDMYMWKQKGMDIYDFQQPRGEARAKKISVKVEVEWESGDKKETSYEVHNPEEDGYIELPFAYWRKCNQVHRWILEHTNQEEDVCQRICLSGEDLIQLRDVCEQVIRDNTKAPELLPTQDGCFFGDTAYDEYYFQDVEYTYKLLKDVNPDDTFIYQASW
jgi:hypothetical protein